MGTPDSEHEQTVLPELHSLHSADLWDMEGSLPEDPENFCLSVEASIGPRGALGEELFEFLVCTPNWLYRDLVSQSTIFGRHFLFVQRYDYRLIAETIEHLCASTSGSTWSEVAERLGRYGKWEFEDYRPSREEK